MFESSSDTAYLLTIEGILISDSSWDQLYCNIRYGKHSATVLPQYFYCCHHTYKY